MRDIIASVAPGTELRDGLERILRGRTGALVVLGYDRTVDSLCTGGFELDVEFSATRVRELAKMDGAVVCDADATRIYRAAVQLVPDPNIPTTESGTRHRTAERVAKQTGHAVVSVSQSMRIIAVYSGDKRHVIDSTDAILTRANQAIATLERYKSRLDEVTSTLTALETEDLVTVRDVAAVLQRLEMVQRITGELSGYIVELGVDGRLLALQLEEVVGGILARRDLVIRDYINASTPHEVSNALADLQPNALVDLEAIAEASGLALPMISMEDPLSPRGFRMLSKIPRLPNTVMERMVDHFGDLQNLLAASIDDLMQVDGVGEGRARKVRDGLTRLADSSIMDRFS